MKRNRLLSVLALIAAASLLAVLYFGGREPERRHTSLLIVVDGLRPDYITPDLMPHLLALGERGVFGDVHSASFPSVTRVNSGTLSTGSYPSRHGLMNNTMYVRQFSEEAFSTGSARRLRQFAEFSSGQLLTAPTLGELLDEQGMRLFVTGSGGSGTSLLLNPVHGGSMGIWTAGGFFVPSAARAEAVKTVGELVDDNASRTVWAFDAYLHKALSEDPPEVVIMWINEPDSAGHRHGVGASETVRAIAHVDEQIGRVVAIHEEHGLSSKVNIFVTSDHGFATSGGRFNLGRKLREKGFGSGDITVVGNMVYLERDDPALLARVVEVLQRDSDVGNIYTRPARPGSSEGTIPGTLSTLVIQWDHERAADVATSPAWRDEVNEFGFAGFSQRGGSAAGHGSDSPYEMQIRLVAAGPAIKRGIRSRVPTGNVDLAPTVLHLLGIDVPPTMDGRVLHELLVEGPTPEEVVVREHTHRAAVTLADGFRYEAELETLEVGSTAYIRGARTRRFEAADE